MKEVLRKIYTSGNDVIEGILGAFGIIGFYLICAWLEGLVS